MLILAFVEYHGRTNMSNQLAISSAFSIIAMAAFALSSPGNARAPFGSVNASFGIRADALALPATGHLLPFSR